MYTYIYPYISQLHQARSLKKKKKKKNVILDFLPYLINVNM